MTVCETFGLACIMYGLSFIHPAAAIGASGGTAFFLMMPFCESNKQRVAMGLISLMFGYSAGVGADNSYAMLAALVSASVGVVTLNTIFVTVQDKDGLFAVISKVLEIIKGLRK